MGAGCDWGVVKEIFAGARLRNAARGITGAMVFDGERFCEFIEGDETEVKHLIEQIAADPRHAAVRVIHAASSAGGRLMQRWSSGYCDASALEPIAGSAGLRGERALEAFIALLANADMD
jgi:Sensors of blue-light using FAD